MSLLDRSPDLVKVRPINLTEADFEQLADCWQSCCCCKVQLNQQAVQMGCCDTICHATCFADFAYHRIIKGTVEFFCPWCSTTLDCKPNDVCSYLMESTVSAVLASSEHLDLCLSNLSKLNEEARVEFMNLAEEYESIRGEPSRAMQLPAKVHAVRKLCGSQPVALQAFETLWEGRETSTDALLTWEGSLISEDDLADKRELIDAKTMYGHGPYRFAPRIVRRLRKS